MSPLHALPRVVRPGSVVLMACAARTMPLLQGSHPLAVSAYGAGHGRGLGRICRAVGDPVGVGGRGYRRPLRAGRALLLRYAVDAPARCVHVFPYRAAPGPPDRAYAERVRRIGGDGGIPCVVVP